MPRAKLANVPLEALQKEIQRRQEALPKLIAARDELNRQIAELQSLGTATPKAEARVSSKRVKKGRRAKNKVSLANALAEALKGKQSLSVAEATEAVLSAGYKTTSNAFRSIVNQTLSKNKRFKSKGRGKYALKQ